METAIAGAAMHPVSYIARLYTLLSTRRYYAHGPATQAANGTWSRIIFFGPGETLAKAEAYQLFLVALSLAESSTLEVRLNNGDPTLLGGIERLPGSAIVLQQISVNRLK